MKFKSDIEVQAGLRDSSGAIGTSGQLLSSTATGVSWTSINGFVPYTGAIQNVDLGTYTLLAAKGVFSSSGSANTVEIGHSSGSGIALNILKAGNGEGLYINKTSGSGNAATIIGTLNATTLVKSGGTAAQILAADGTVITAGTNITISGGTISASGGVTGSGTPNTLPRFTASTTIGDSAVTDNGTTIVLGRATSTLAAATESNSITITQPSFTTDQPVKLLNFNWYSEPWSIGNIRSSSSPSNGLGIFATSVEKVRFQTNAVILQQGVNLVFKDNPSINWGSNYLEFKNVDNSIPVIRLRANGTNNQAPRFDMYNAADNNVTVSLNGELGTGVFNSSLTSADYRFNADGYITYDTTNSGTATFQIRKFATNVLSFNASNQASFVSNVVLSGKLGVATGNPRTRAEFVSGLPTSIPTFTDTTNGIAITDGGAIYGRLGVSNFSSISGGYPTYIQSGDYTAAIYYNLLLNPLGGNVGIGVTNPDSKLTSFGNIKIGNALDNSSQWIGKSNNGTETFRGAIKFTSTTTDDIIQFNTHRSGVSSDIRMTIDGIGNVGIGITNPSSLLEISKNSALGGGFLNIVNTNTAMTGKIADINFKLTDSVGTVKNAAYIQVIPDSINIASGASMVFFTRKGDADPSESLRINNTGAATFSSSVTTNGNVNVQNGSVFAGLGGPASSRGFYAGSSGFQASFLYNNTTGNLDISPRAGYDTIFTEGQVSINNRLNVNSNNGISAIFTGQTSFDGANRVHIVNSADIYGRTNLVLTGRLDDGNDAYSFGINGRNSLVFNMNEGGPRSSVGTEFFSIQLQGVTKALYIQSRNNSDNGRQGTTFFQSGNISLGSVTDAGFKLDVNGSVRATSFSASSGGNVAVITQTGSGGYGFVAQGASGAARDIFLAGQIGYSNGFTVQYNGSNMFYQFLDGNINVPNGNITATGFFQSSDERLKDIISRNGDVITYKWKDGRDDKIHVGYPAQEIQKVMPDAVNEDAEGMLSVNYIEVLVKKIQDLENRIKELEK